MFRVISKLNFTLKAPWTLECFSNDSIHFNYIRELVECIENIWLQVKSVIESKLKEDKQVLAGDTENALKDQILSLSNKESEVRKLLWTRATAYVRLVKSNQTNQTLPPVPPGYTDISDELQTLANSFKRLTVYNYSVFGDHYDKLFDEQSKSNVKSESKSEATTSRNSMKDTWCELSKNFR